MTSLGFTGKIAPQPPVRVGLEDSQMIKRLLKHGPVSLHFSATNRVRTDVEISNVIAELSGKDAAAGVVLVSAHLDSWQPGIGARTTALGSQVSSRPRAP
jgi:carboxypeptidase Q